MIYSYDLNQRSFIFNGELILQADTLYAGQSVSGNQLVSVNT